MKLKVSRLLILPAAVCIIVSLCSWGVWGHEHINRSAIFALPAEMRVFYYNHMDFITVEATGPDMKRSVYADKSESPKHYIDLELFDKPIDSLPQTSADKAKIYNDTILQKSGSLPWQIQDVMAKLTKAFKEQHKNEILLLSADLGHYLGDATMPLHTSLNYDGQLTGQNGVHALWESRLPEAFGDTYNLNTRPAKYIDNITRETWRIIKNSHQLADSILAADRLIKHTLPQDKWYKKDEKDNVVKTRYNTPVPSDEYARAFHKALHGMVERQMQASITAVADFWYTAWVNAGKPDLSRLDDPELTLQNKAALAKDYEAWKKGKLTKMKPEPEY